MIGFPDKRRKRWRERGLLFRILAYTTIVAWGLIIAIVVLTMCVPLGDEALENESTLRPEVPTPPPGDYRGGAVACALLYEVREAILDGELDDNKLRNRLDEIRLSATHSEPALLEASKQTVAAVDLDRVEAFLDAIDVMVHTCNAYGYNPP